MFDRDFVVFAAVSGMALGCTKANTLDSVVPEAGGTPVPSSQTGGTKKGGGGQGNPSAEVPSSGAAPSGDGQDPMSGGGTSSPFSYLATPTPTPSSTPAPGVTPSPSPSPSPSPTPVTNQAPPAPSAVTISPAMPYVWDNLQCQVTAGGPDPQGDPVSLAYAWSRNGSVIVGASGASLASSQFVAGDVVTCGVRSSDGSLQSMQIASAGVTALGFRLAGHFRFDEAPFASVPADASGAGLVASYAGDISRVRPRTSAVEKAPLAGNVASLNLLDAKMYVTALNYGGVFNLGSTFTQAFWLRPDVVDNGYHAVLGWSSQYTAAQDRAPTIWVFDRTRLHFGFGSGGAWLSDNTPPVLTEGAWNHVGIAFDGTSHRVYVNGTLVHTSTVASGATSLPHTRFDVGGIDGNLRGFIDDVRVYKRALSGAEMAALSSDGAVSASNLVAHYRFDEGPDANYFADASSSLALAHHADMWMNVDSDVPAPLAGANVASAFFNGDDWKNLHVTGFSGGSLAAGRFTVATWLKRRRAGSGWQSVMGRQSTGSGNRSPSMFIDPTGHVQLSFGPSGSFCSVMSIGVLGVDTWHHLAGTFDGTTAEVFIDGVSAGSANCVGKTPRAIDNYWLGYVDTNDDLRLTNLDDARIYDTALSSAQVASLAAGTNVTGNGLIAHWSFDEVQVVAGEFQDSSGLGNALESDSIRGSSGPSATVPAALSGSTRSLAFDGYDAESRVDITLPAGSTLDTVNFSRSLWIYQADAMSGYRSLIGNKQQPGLEAVTLWIVDGTRLSVGLGDNGSNSTGITTGPVVTLGAWNHVGMTFDGTRLRLYVNGVKVLDDSTTWAGFAGWDTPTLRVGYSDLSFSSGFVGLMDDLRFYDGILTDAQMQTLSMGGNP